MTPFALATFSSSMSQPFAALVVEEQALPLRAITGLRADRIGVLLQDWPEKLPQLEAAATSIGQGVTSEWVIPVAQLRAHAPFTPRNLYCTGANYRGHVGGMIRGDASMRQQKDAHEDPAALAARVDAELERRAKTGKPYCFVKLTSCIAGPNDDLVLPRDVEKPDWELELAVVIGRAARRVTAADAMSYVAGYAIINDVTARDLVFPKGGAGGIGADWLAGKCHPGFAPFGPWLVPAQQITNVYDLEINLVVNGKPMQHERTSDMLIDISRQIEHLSSIVTLQPGDVIATGSPAGNGAMHGVFLKPGDVMEGSISGLGEQRVRCIAEP
jgi:2,4-didehydro-3-deoxy-L-rhamnonate hydrolase